MKLRKQVVLTGEAWAAVQELTAQANEGFKLGHINYSDTINAMVLGAKVNVEALRGKHTNVKRTLKSWASKKEVDLNALIKDLNELRSKSAKRMPSTVGKDGL